MISARGCSSAVKIDKKRLKNRKIAKKIREIVFQWFLAVFTDFQEFQGLFLYFSTARNTGISAIRQCTQTSLSSESLLKVLRFQAPDTSQSPHDRTPYKRTGNHPDSWIHTVLIHGNQVSW